MSTWKSQQVSHHYLEGVRGAIPLAREQIDLMLRLIGSGTGDVNRFLDLGAGDGVLSRAMFEQYPVAFGVLVDFSKPMIKRASDRFDTTGYRVELLHLDYCDPDWVNTVSGYSPFDAIVSGFSIHHLPDQEKQRVYQEIFDLLIPEGIFLNLEHVASSSKWGTAIFDEAFIDALYHHQLSRDMPKEYASVATTYHAREDKEDNRLTLVEDQCEWLRDIGFEQVDCYFKYLELALFGGRKPR